MRASRRSAPREIDAAREYFVGLHTRLSDAWQSLDRVQRAAPRRMAAAGGRCVERQRPPLAHRERRDLRSRRRRIQRRHRRATAGGGERAAYRARRPAVSRHGHELRRASCESVRADFACQRAAVHRARRRGLVVRRRVRPHAGLSIRRRRAHLARGGARRVRCPRARAPIRCSRKPATNISTCRIAARRAASAGCSPMTSTTPPRKSAATSSIASR